MATESNYSERTGWTGLGRDWGGLRRRLPLVAVGAALVIFYAAAVRSYYRGSASGWFEIYADLSLLGAAGLIGWVSRHLGRLEDARVEHAARFQSEIVERRLAEDRLRQLSRAVEQTPASIVITDADGRIEYVNPGFVSNTGYTAAEAIGQNPRVLKSGLHPPEFYAQLWATITAGRDWRGEIRNRRKNGALFWEQASISPVRDDRGRITHFIAVKEDIDERKRTEDMLLQRKAELQQSNAQLEVAMSQARESALAADAANRAKDAFLASMSHELRTPLNSIIGLASTLGGTESPEDLAQSAALILESGQNLLGIVEEILDFSGLQAGRAKLNSQAFRLIDVVNHCLHVTVEAAKAKGLQVSYWVAPNVPAEVVGDSKRIRQILLNLLTNAVKYTSAGRVHLNVTARPGAGADWRLSFTVLDSGRGIGAEGCARLFQPFSRIQENQLTEVSGTGLGLAVSRSFAQLMGGDIALRSRPGIGSAFRCSISVGGFEGGAAAMADLARAELTGRSVLVVDSDRRRRRLWCAAGGAWGLKITAVEDPSASDQGMPAGGSFDLVILGGGAPSPALVRWLGPGGAGQGVPRVWANRTDTDLGPPGASERRLAASFIDLAELARLLAEVVNRTPAAKSPPGKPGVGGGVPVLGQRLPLRILAADDIRTNRAMLSRMMQFLGYTIDLVENGAEVLDAVRQNPYDLILLDVQMPVMDGLTAARTLVNLYPDRSTRPRIVALTANALHGDREACLAAGMDEYLSKPILPKDIERCIERLFTPNPTISTGGVSGANAAVGVDLPWLDREHLQTVFPGLPNGEFRDTLVELIGVAGEDFGRMRPQLIDACRVRDMKAVAECAHALKGCFATLAWTRAARFCADAVVRARQGGFSEWDSLPADLDRLYAASSAALTSYLAEGAGSAAEFREQSAA